MTIDSTEHSEGFRQWAVLELMGHRRLAGMVTEQQIGGASFIRIDVPGKEVGEAVSTQFYAPGAVYCITPTTEETARLFAANHQPEPISTWDIRQPALEATVGSGSDVDFDDDDRDQAGGWR